jgi:transcriptional regulator with XRE-family HTH domain
MMQALAQWIVQELEQRSWRAADLAHRAGITEATLSRILSGKRKAGPEVCAALADAFQVPAEQVFRLAGLLPSVPDADEQEDEALGLFRRLDAPMRQIALGMLRTLDRQQPAADGPRTLSERLAQQIARELEAMPPQDQQRVLELMRQLRGAEQVSVVPVEPQA